MQVDFYQLSDGPAEQVIASIADKIIAQDGRLLIVASDEGAFFGIAFMITPNVGTFAEARYTVFSVNPGGRSTEFDIETVHFVGGLSFRW